MTQTIKTVDLEAKFIKHRQDLELPTAEALYAKLVDLSRQPGGERYDFDYIYPNRYYHMLEGLGLVKIGKEGNGNTRWRRAKLTMRGQEYLGNVRTLRRRRRRR